jgi:hypothetical protein
VQLLLEGGKRQLHGNLQLDALYNAEKGICQNSAKLQLS